MNFLIWIVFGAIAGWLASILMRTNASQGIVMDIIIGIVGAIVGGFLFSGVFGMEGGGYEGAFSWLPSTWERQRFPGYPSRAVDATPRQQTLVFRRYKNAGEWPTMAKC